MIYFFIIGGLFLGWSLGANHTANIFGPAVGSRMLKFRTAAIIASIFVILGAVISGSGTANTLERLGHINLIGASFVITLAAAITVSLMTKSGLPVSTTQAIIGGIVGWNIFSQNLINVKELLNIVLTWIISPILAGVFSFLLFKLVRLLLKRIRIHILRMDLYTRRGLILVGAFGAYSLGANNMANVMGVFVSSNPFGSLLYKNYVLLNSLQVLFLIGGLSIAVGIFTYSFKVIKTIGKDIFKLSPVAALIAVFSESLVLFIFASSFLNHVLNSIGLPSIPLVPVSSSQAVIGAVIGIALSRGAAKAVKWNILGKISIGWVLTPLASAILTFVLLFIMQNVFDVRVKDNKTYIVSEKALKKARSLKIIINEKPFSDSVYHSELELYNHYKRQIKGSFKSFVSLVVIDSITVDTSFIKDTTIKRILAPLNNKDFLYTWELEDTLTHYGIENPHLIIKTLKKQKNFIQ